MTVDMRTPVHPCRAALLPQEPNLADLGSVIADVSER